MVIFVCFPLLYYSFAVRTGKPIKNHIITNQYFNDQNKNVDADRGG